MSHRRPKSYVYLLRIWQIGTPDAPEWRMMLEALNTRDRIGFVDLEGLSAFLHEQISPAVADQVRAHDEHPARVIDRAAAHGEHPAEGSADQDR